MLMMKLNALYYLCTISLPCDSPAQIPSLFGWAGLAGPLKKRRWLLIAG